MPSTRRNAHTPKRRPSLRAWRRPYEALLWHLWTTLVVLAGAGAFYLPAIRRTGGVWPVPLDDTYIYFGFARSFALGHPLSWIPGNGYSSGCTSLVYPLLLAPGHVLGLTGSALGIFAAALAVVFLVDLCRSLRVILHGHWASWWVPPLVLSVPLVDWSWFSGMETALFGAVMGRSLLALQRSVTAPPTTRRRAQLGLGAWLALLVLTRPETVALALPLGAAAVYGARSLPTASSLARALGPCALALLAQAGLNRALTGEWAPAGAARKLIGSVPYWSPTERAVAWLKNVVVIHNQAFERALAVWPLGWALLLLVLVAVVARPYRLVAVPLVLGSGGTLLLVCWNTTARYQNLRYAAPALAMLLATAALGLASCLRQRRWSVVGAAAGLLAIFAPVAQFERQVDHFGRASANIVAQHGEVARRLRAMAPRPRRLLVGDAGAIPYLSAIPAIDGLGLGGFRGLPFARASVHGVPAVVELIERLPAADRPDVLALYPGWWRGLTDPFGRRTDSVRIADNVICAADEKVIYRADWSLLGPAAPDDPAQPSTGVSAHGAHREGQIDRVDVGDLIEERAHDYQFPTPHGGWMIGAALVADGPDGGTARRYDAGRIVPQGRSESFVVAGHVPAGPTALVLRTDCGADSRVRVDVLRAGHVISTVTAQAPRLRRDHWTEMVVVLREAAGGDTVRITAARSAWHSFHIWLVRPPQLALAVAASAVP